MKKLILSVAVFATIISCEKEEVRKNAVINASSNEELSKMSVGKNTTNVYDKATRVWLDNGNPNGTDGIDFGCFTGGGGCLPDVVVKPRLIADVRGVGEVILHGKPEDIKNEFKGKRTILEEIIQTAHINGVINGAINVAVRGLENEKFYMIFSNKADKKLIAVYPIK